MTTRARDLFTIAKKVFSNDFELFHIIEKYSTSSNLLYVQLSFGRILKSLLMFCRTDNYSMMLEEEMADQPDGIV